MAETGKSGVKPEASATPGLIVSGWLFACAALMFALMPFSETGSMQLAFFGAILLLIALLIAAFIALKHRRKAI
jgi:membrane associated rhomboid family serine protease